MQLNEFQVINAKTIARIGAIQILYQYQQAELVRLDLVTLKQNIIDFYHDAKLNNDEDFASNKPLMRIKLNKKHLERLVESSVSNMSILDHIISCNLKSEQNKESRDLTIELKLNCNDILDSSSQIYQYKPRHEKLYRINDLPPLLLALLRVSISELLYIDETPNKVVINEFTMIASDMLMDREVGFVNSILDKIAI
jgi:transcription termination factor NusB